MTVRPSSVLTHPIETLSSCHVSVPEAMAGPVREFDEAVDAFITTYPDIKYEARRRLGDAYAEGDFPPASRLKQRFDVKLTYLPVPSTEDFRVNLSSDEIAAVRRNADEALRGTVNDAVRSLLDRLQEPVARMATRLRLFRRSSGGKVQHPFRDSLVENVRAIGTTGTGTEPHGRSAHRCALRRYRAPPCSP